MPKRIPPVLAQLVVLADADGLLEYLELVAGILADRDAWKAAKGEQSSG